MKLYLASTSPRRRELLETLGIPFEVIAPKFQEEMTGFSPEGEALFFAEGKARSVAPLCPDAWIIGSDTLIECEGEKIGKPEDEEEAKRILRRLSGRSHRVISAVVLLNTADGTLKKQVDSATVTFHPLTEKEIDEYVATGEPLDKAGAYAVQGEGRRLVSGILGDVNTVIGLPLKSLLKFLENSEKFATSAAR